jgi:hypothetical protein
MPGADNISDFTLIEDGGSVVVVTEGDGGFGEGGFGEGPFGGGQTVVITNSSTVWTEITTP